MRIAGGIAAAAALLACAWNAQAQDAPQASGARDEAPVRLVFRDRPSLRFGDVLRVDFRVKLQGDWRWFTPVEREPASGRFDLHRRRFGLQGRFLHDFEYEIEYETRSGEKRPWRDVFVNFDRFDGLNVQAGKFKVPFSREQLTGAFDQDFIFRSLAASTLAPARDRGVMVHGRPVGRVVDYQLGLFRHDGETARIAQKSHTGGTVGARVVVTPFRRARRHPLRAMDLGVAFTSGNVREGLHSLSGEAVFGETFFERVYVQGRRLRVGTELNWTPGPFGLKAEFIHLQDDRDEQGLGDADLPRYIGRGWYVTGTVLLTGENKSGGIQPRHELFRGGVGAIELAARYEALRFGSSEHLDEPFANPRASNLLGNSDRVLTVGVNWYLNRWVKLQINGIRERIEDPERAPVIGRDEYWSRVVRLQFVM